jgi:hypothetical protein
MVTTDRSPNPRLEQMNNNAEISLLEKLITRAILAQGMGYKKGKKAPRRKSDSVIRKRKKPLEMRRPESKEIVKVDIDFWAIWAAVHPDCALGKEAW